MFLFDWFYGILTSLGLRQKEANTMLLGLDEYCKMRLLYKILCRDQRLYRKLKEEERLFLCQKIYRPQRTSAELSIGKIKFKVFDLGGHQITRRVWNDYNAKVNAVVYVLRASHRERLAEPKAELDALLSDESLANVPFLILAYGSFTACEELLSSLGLTNFTTGKGKVNLGDTNVRPLEVFTCDIFSNMGDMGDENSGMGENSGFKWLSQYIK